MQKHWYRLDTAALIFPAIVRRDWSNVFRVSATLTEPVDPVVLQQAADDLKPRFPSFYAVLKRGFFWYYLLESPKPPHVREDFAYPLAFMSSRERKSCCLRVLYYQNRIAVECFHALSDGHGGSVYLCSLLARYLELKHGIRIPSDGSMVLNAGDKPTEAELEDSFLKNAAECAASRRESRAYRLHGRRERGGFRHLTTGIVPTKALTELAHRYQVTVTALLAGLMARSILEMQALERKRKRQKPVKITLPVDLRRLYGSRTLRNFALVLNLGVDPRFGDYTLEELCRNISHQLAAEATPQHMAGMIAANVQPQQQLLLRLAPVGIKNLVMRLIYRHTGESGGCINISNLGRICLPEEMAPYTERLEFIIGPQISYPNNCSVLSYGGKTCINMIRSIRESELERRFFAGLVELGIPVDIESNRR